MAASSYFRERLVDVRPGVVVALRDYEPRTRTLLVQASATQEAELERVEVPRLFLGARYHEGRYLGTHVGHPIGQPCEDPLDLEVGYPFACNVDRNFIVCYGKVPGHVVRADPFAAYWNSTFALDRKFRDGMYPSYLRLRPYSTAYSGRRAALTLREALELVEDPLGRYHVVWS